MIRAGDVRVWVATAPVDMRKGFDTLAEYVRSFLGHDPLSGSMFVFRNRSGQRLKVLWWDRNGLALYYKRLEQGAFPFPSPDAPEQKSVSVDAAQLMRLLEGLEVGPAAASR